MKIQSEYSTIRKMLPTFPEEERGYVRRFYQIQKGILQETFPRGRFVMWEDGQAALVARNKGLCGWRIAIYGPGKLQLYYRGGSMKYLKGIPADLILQKIPCADEGIWILKADPRLAEALPWFSKGNQIFKNPVRTQENPVQGPAAITSEIPSTSDTIPILKELEPGVMA